MPLLPAADHCGWYSFSILLRVGAWVADYIPRQYTCECSSISVFQHSATYDFLHYINILTYLLTYVLDGCGVTSLTLSLGQKVMCID